VATRCGQPDELDERCQPHGWRPVRYPLTLGCAESPKRVGELVPVLWHGGLRSVEKSPEGQARAEGREGPAEANTAVATDKAPNSALVHGPSRFPATEARGTAFRIELSKTARFRRRGEASSEPTPKHPVFQGASQMLDAPSRRGPAGERRRNPGVRGKAGGARGRETLLQPPAAARGGDGVELEGGMTR
jgi:hypothetical protein